MANIHVAVFTLYICSVYSCIKSTISSRFAKNLLNIAAGTCWKSISWHTATIQSQFNQYILANARWTLHTNPRNKMIQMHKCTMDDAHKFSQDETNIWKRGRNVCHETRERLGGKSTLEKQGLWDWGNMTSYYWYHDTDCGCSSLSYLCTYVWINYCARHNLILTK